MPNLTPARDNHGFAATMSRKTKVLLRLRDLYLSRFKRLYPDVVLDESLPVIIAGEWTGPNIQHGVAVAQLSKRFVICSIMIDGAWQNDADFSGISLPHHGIYNVSRAGIFTATLYPNDTPRTLAEVEPLAEQVAKHCPFAATFDVHGPGEGIVWKIVGAEYTSNPDLWFKTKGGKFKPTFAKPPKRTQSFGSIEEKRAESAVVAKLWCSEQRMEQGLDVLREKGVERDVRALGEFLKWVQGDIAVEEREFIRKCGVDEGSLRIEVAKIARPWFLGRVKRWRVGLKQSHT